MRATNKRLTILSEAEQAALYELPDFDDEQRLEYLNLTAEEQVLMQRRSHLSDKIYCALQIGYFKAKHLFFRFTWEEAEEDTAFIGPTLRSLRCAATCEIVNRPLPDVRGLFVPSH
jgi:hypothetical protein